MTTWTQNPIFQTPTFRRLYACGAAGFVLLALGYLARETLAAAYPGAVYTGLHLLLGVFPNLFGSFGTPFVLLLLLAARLGRADMLRNWRAFGLANLATLAGALVIEWLHVAFNLGVWDNQDVLASLIGAAATLLVFWVAGKRSQ